MLFTRASEYALLSLIFIAQKSEPVDVDTISKELEISKSFLAKILQNLAREKILHSYKGANGGFMLALAPQSLSIKRIIEGAERRRPSVFDCAIDPKNCPTQKASLCQILPMFNTFQERVDEMLEATRLSDILRDK